MITATSFLRSTLFMLAVGVALLIRVWHMPSDVLGGYLLGTLWIALAVSCLRAAERRSSELDRVNHG